jgi:hypothetical protein
LRENVPCNKTLFTYLPSQSQEYNFNGHHILCRQTSSPLSFCFIIILIHVYIVWSWAQQNPQATKMHALLTQKKKKYRTVEELGMSTVSPPGHHRLTAHSGDLPPSPHIQRPLWPMFLLWSYYAIHTVDHTSITCAAVRTQLIT